MARKLFLCNVFFFFFLNTLNHPIIYIFKMPEKKSDLFSGQTQHFNEVEQENSSNH